MKRIVFVVLLLFISPGIFSSGHVKAQENGDIKLCDEEYSNAVYENDLTTLKCQQNCTAEFSQHIAEKAERASCWSGCGNASDQTKKE
jgi:hypothetical protein